MKASLDTLVDLDLLFPSRSC